MNSIIFTSCFYDHMDDLINIFYQLQVNDTEKIKEATRIIMEIEQDVGTLQLVIQVFSNNLNDFIRQQAVISIKRMLELHWQYIYHLPYAEDIKITLFNLIQNETNSLILHLLVYSLEPICKYMKECPWPELEQLVRILLESENSVSLDVAFKLVGAIISSKETDIILSLLPKVSKTIVTVFQADDPELICSAADLVSSLIQLFDILPNELEHLYFLLTQIFQNAVANASNYLYHLSNAINNTICESGVVSPISQIKFLLSLANNENCEPRFLFYIFDPISTIVSKHLEKIISNRSLIDLLVIVYQSTARCFVDDYLDEQSDCEFIMSILEIIIQSANNLELFEIMESVMLDDLVNSQFANLLVFQQFIDESPFITTEKLPKIIKYILEHSLEGNHSCIREESLVCIQHIINTVNGGLKDYLFEILDSCIQAISSQEGPIIDKGLVAITELLSTLAIPKEYISDIFNILTSIAENGSFLDSVITALSALTFSASNNIIDYVEPLYNIFYKYAIINEDEHPLLKSESIKGLVYLVLASPGNLKNVTSQIIQFICEITQKDSNSPISYCTISAFILIAHAAIPELAEYVGTPINLIASVFSEDLPVEPGEDELEIYSSLFDIIIGAIILLQNLVKNYSASIKENIANLYKIIKKFVSYPVPEIQIHSIKTMTQLCISYPNDLDPNIIMQKLIKHFDSDDPFIVSTLFKSFKKIIQSNIEYGQGSIYQVLSCALHGIKKQLYCQKDESEFDIDLVMNIFNFINSVALVHPGIISVDKIIKLIKSHQKDLYIRVFGSKVLSSLIICYDDLHVISKKIIVKFIIDAIEDCDGTIQPIPLQSIRLVLEKEPNLLNNDISRIMELIDSILSLGNEGQPAYSETIAGAVSFLYSLCRIDGGDYVERLIPILLELDIITDPNESQNIYESLLILISNNEEVFEPYYTHIIKIISGLFSMEPQEFQRMNLSDDLIINMIQMFKTIQPKLPNPEEIIIPVLDNFSYNYQMKY